MRFTFPILTLSHGGAQRMLVELTNGLTARGHQVVIVMPLGGDVSYDVRSTLLITDYPLLRESDFPSVISSSPISTLRFRSHRQPA